MGIFTDMNEAIAAGKTAIDGADSVEKVTEALAEAKAAIDEVKTDEELTEAQLMHQVLYAYLKAKYRK